LTAAAGYGQLKWQGGALSMAKFPTEVERSITVKVPIEKAYKYLWDVVGSSGCIPGLAHCKKVAPNTYQFVYQERATGPVKLSVQYTAQYESDGKQHIRFAGTTATGDNTDVDGEIKLSKSGEGTKILLRQKLAPDTPVPSLLQGLIRSYVEKEAGAAVKEYLGNVKQALEGGRKA
jgi:carbon monoxide dehydrogenase subunit G